MNKTMFLKSVILYFIVTNYSFVKTTSTSPNDHIDPMQTIVWGPGLKPDLITLRARYIFLQLVDHKGQNITKSAGTGIIAANISGSAGNGQLCQVWTEIMDCKDGSYIVRYNLYNTCNHLKIDLKVKNELLNLSSISINDVVYEEECYCPVDSIRKWMIDNTCIFNDDKIQKQLQYFPSVNFDEIRKEIIAKYDRPNSVSICHYILKANKIFRKCYGQYIGFKIFVDTILQSLMRKVVLPDTEFFINLGDWPLVPKNGELYPIFSFCGSEEFYDIILPTYELTQSSLENMGKVIMDMLSIQGKIMTSWEEKEQKVFWRGRDSNRIRLKLIDIAKQDPQLFNVSLTNYFFFKSEIAKYGPAQKHVSFFDFFEYKYQLNIDGTVAAYRFPYLLAGNSVVFKQTSKYYEFFYEDLKPGIHYIPVKADLSDLVEKVKWAVAHDKEAYKISQQARQYIRENLLPQNIYCYLATIFKEWSERVENPIHIQSQMEEVNQPDSNCECHRINNYSKDEL